MKYFIRLQQQLIDSNIQFTCQNRLRFDYYIFMIGMFLFRWNLEREEIIFIQKKEPFPMTLFSFLIEEEKNTFKHLDFQIKCCKLLNLERKTPLFKWKNQLVIPMSLSSFLIENTFKIPDFANNFFLTFYPWERETNYIIQTQEPVTEVIIPIPISWDLMENTF